MSRFTLFLVIVLVGLLVIAGAVLLTRSEPLLFTETEAGKTVELEVDEEFSIRLAGNPTTGYTWEVVATEGAVVEQVGEPVFESESDLVGASGRVTLNFKATTPGRQVLQLVYHRSWEEDAAPQNTFNLSVVVVEQ